MNSYIRTICISAALMALTNAQAQQCAQSYTPGMSNALISSGVNCVIASTLIYPGYSLTLLNPGTQLYSDWDTKIEGSLIVQTGAQFLTLPTNGFLRVGTISGATPSIQVSGPGSRLHAGPTTGYLEMGSGAATTTLSITNGGVMEVDTNAGNIPDALLGSQFALHGTQTTINISGAGSHYIQTGHGGDASFVQTNLGDVNRSSPLSVTLNLSNGGWFESPNFGVYRQSPLDPGAQINFRIGDDGTGNLASGKLRSAFLADSVYFDRWTLAVDSCAQVKAGDRFVLIEYGPSSTAILQEGQWVNDQGQGAAIPDGGIYSTGGYTFRINYFENLGQDTISWYTGAVQGVVATVLSTPAAAPSCSVPVPVTITSSTTGLPFSVSGSGCQAGTFNSPSTLQWTRGSACTVTFPNTQPAGAGTQYAFNGWTDGNSANPRTIPVPVAAATYTAAFKTQYQLSVSASPAGAASLTGNGFYDAGTTATVTESPNAGYFFRFWTGAVASASDASTTVAMTAPQSVVANFVSVTSVTVQPVAGQYSDPVTLSASVSTPAPFSGLLQFQVDGTNAGSAIPVTGSGSYTSRYIIANTAGSHMVTAILTANPSMAVVNSGSNGLTVSKEDATLLPAGTNPQTVQVSAPGGTANTVTLKGTVTEASDGSPGGITNAVVTVTLQPAVAGTLAIACPVANANGALTAVCASVPVNAYVVRWNTGGSYYQGPGVDSVLAVFDPSLGFVTGSGTVLDNGVSADFAISIKYLKDGTLNGGITYIEHRATGPVTVSTSALTSMSLVGATAVILGSATVNGVDGYSLVATVTNNGSPGINRDLFGLQLTGGTLAPSISFAPAAITSGNLQTH